MQSRKIWVHTNTRARAALFINFFTTFTFKEKVNPAFKESIALRFANMLLVLKSCRAVHFNKDQ